MHGSELSVVVDIKKPRIEGYTIRVIRERGKFTWGATRNIGVEPTLEEMLQDLKLMVDDLQGLVGGD